MNSNTANAVSFDALVLLICGLFRIAAFYNALVNWQRHAQRMGAWREFLSTDDSWWPS